MTTATVAASRSFASSFCAGAVLIWVMMPSIMLVGMVFGVMASTVGVVPRHDLGERVVARERRGKDDTSVVAQAIGQSPAFGQLCAFTRRLVPHDQRNARVAHGIQTDCHGQLSHTIESGAAFG